VPARHGHPRAMALPLVCQTHNGSSSRPYSSTKWHLPKVVTPLECHLNQAAFLDATTFGRCHLP